MDGGELIALGSPAELKATVGSDAVTLEEVFLSKTGPQPQD